MNKTVSHCLIAHIENDFSGKFGIPRQSGLIDDLTSLIVFEKEYRVKEALRGIEGFSRLWLLWQFSENKDQGWHPTVRPPRLGGNRRVGVFATRSPFRPNAIGLSSVKLIGVENTPDRGTVLLVRGADLMNGTPILDIKPYLPFTDAHPDAVGGFAEAVLGDRLSVEIPPAWEQKIPPEKRKALRKMLTNDPRPSYQEDATRIYKMSFSTYTVSFRVENGILTVTEIQ